jgi:hypothetical protein
MTRSALYPEPDINLRIYGYMPRTFTGAYSRGRPSGAVARPFLDLAVIRDQRLGGFFVGPVITGGCYRICYPTQHNRTQLDHINMVG